MTRPHRRLTAAPPAWRANASARIAAGRVAPDRGSRLVPALGRLPPLARFGLLGTGAVALVSLGAALGASGSAVVREPTDFTIYYAAAHVLLAGGNPYGWHALRQVVPDVVPLGYVYPLWGILVFVPLAALPLNVAAGIWLVVNLTCLALALILLARLAGISPRSRWLPGLFLATCGSIPGLFAVLQGQIALPLLVAVVGAAWAARRGLGGWTGALLALALLKPQFTWLPILAVLAIAFHRGVLRSAALSLMGVAAALIVVSFVIRPVWVGNWLAALHQAENAGGAGQRALWANMGTVPALAVHLPAPLGAAVLMLAGLAGVFSLAMLAARALTAPAGSLHTSPDATALAEARLLAGAILVGSVLTPWMWIYDGVFWLVPVAIAVARGPGWRRWGSLLALVALPWLVRAIHVASTPAAGTSLNKLEDVLVAPVLLALMLIEPRQVRALIARWHDPLSPPNVAGAPTPATPAGATHPATPAGRRR